MAFDFFDRKEKTFVSREYLERMLEGTGTSQVPLIESCEKISRNQLLGFMKRQVSVLVLNIQVCSRQCFGMEN